MHAKTLGCQKIVLDPLELGIQREMSHHVGAGSFARAESVKCQARIKKKNKTNKKTTPKENGMIKWTEQEL